MSDPMTPPPAGGGAEPAPGSFRRRPAPRWWILLAVVLLAINWLIAGSLAGGAERPTIAYSPLFVQQTRAGNVAEISSTGTGEIQGSFRKPVKVAGAGSVRCSTRGRRSRQGVK